MNKTDSNSFKLKPSGITGAGIGVFALHDIDSDVFLALKPREKVGVQLNKIDIPEELLDYCIEETNGTYTCPPEFNHMHVVWYLNHSNTPNAELREGGYFSIKNIEKGQEILIDYKIFHEPGSNEIQFDSKGKLK